MDDSGLRHSLDVDAGSLFEAAAMGLEAFKRAECTSRFPEHVQLEVRTSDRQFKVALYQLKEWAGRNAKSPREKILKQRLLRSV